MRHKLWAVLFVFGLVVTARPVAGRMKRCWLQWNASRVWKTCRLDSKGGRAGDPYGWLNVPSAGIDLMVLEGADKENLAHFPCAERVGHSTLIMAHRDTHFTGLGKIKMGQPILLERRGGEPKIYKCEVIHVVEKEEVRALIEKYADKDRLLLLTCYPFRYVGPAPQRYLVVARAFVGT